jgi:hypothetical protein
MKKSPLQFSLAALLLTVAVVAGDLALMTQVPTEPAYVSFFVTIIALTAFALIGLGGPPGLRAFCIGALVPLGVLVYFLAQDLGVIAFWLEHPFQGYDYSGIPPRTHVDSFPRLLGVGVLMSIVLGYLCVGFRWLIEKREG